MTSVQRLYKTHKHLRELVKRGDTYIQPVNVYKMYTPGSTKSLFSDFFKEFWRGILGVFGTIQGRFGKVSSGNIKGNKMNKLVKLSNYIGNKSGNIKISH